MIQERRTTADLGKLAAALLIGFSTTLACVAATAEPQPARSPEVQPLTTPGQPGATADALAAPQEDAGAADSGDGGCPHGALEDPHRGFVRCLQPGEKSPIQTGEPDAGSGDGGAPDATPPSAPSAPPSAAPSAPPSTAPSAPPLPGPVPLIEMKTPKFDNGDVPKAEKTLSGTKLTDAIAKCVSEAGGLTGKSGSLKVELLVRLRGKAEGVEVTAQGGVPPSAAKCVQTLLKNRTIGSPSADPVGVTVIYNLKSPGK